MATAIDFSFRILICSMISFTSDTFEIYDSSTYSTEKTVTGYFVPYEKSFVGYYGDPSNYQRERINEGAYETPEANVMFYDGPQPRQVCPGMVGPFSDGSYYCTGREYGYCDRRSGTCFCNMGYQGIDCFDCTPSYYKVGELCFPKKNCPSDCSFAGECDYSTGTCHCLPHRKGEDCGTMVCTSIDSLCQTCTSSTCLKCTAGYYLDTLNHCQSCYQFDHRCAGCTLDEGCTVCADPLLTSVRRSGYRASDPRLPLEEDTRELSITLPFGTKSPEAFADAEAYFIATTPDQPLYKNTISCSQGLFNDAEWYCSPVNSSYGVCGHKGVFRFKYPNYVISESDKTIRMSVLRSGGGVGNITIQYYIRHINTNDSDVSPTMPYTTVQTLFFDTGVVERTFLINILNDPILEPDEVFQVVLGTPEGGGATLGAQYRANVTIRGDDPKTISPRLSHPLLASVMIRAGHNYSVPFVAILHNGKQAPMLSSDVFYCVLENYQQFWNNPGTVSKSQRQTNRKVCSVQQVYGQNYYNASGTIIEQGRYQLRLYHMFPGGLKGEYHMDAFLGNLALTRIDRAVNFTWGEGRILPRATDFVSVRWSGLVLTSSAGMYYFKVIADGHARLWLDGVLVIDHWQDQRVWTEAPRGIYLDAFSYYEVILDYRHVRGNAFIRFMWGHPSSTSMNVIPEAHLFSSYELGRSPVIINVRSEETIADTTECTGDGLHDAVSAIPSSFRICPRDKYLNMRDDDDAFYLLSALFSSLLTLVNDLGHNGVGSERIWPILEFDHESHCFIGTYTAFIAGIYKLEIWYQSGPDEPKHELPGSPFTVSVTVRPSSAPYSEIHGLGKPQLLQAGHCHNFTVIMRDLSRNFRFMGGDDLEVYMLQLSVAGAVPRDAQGALMFDSASDKSVKYGRVVDLNNGTYALEICPVIADWHEVHVIFYGDNRQVKGSASGLSSSWNGLQDDMFGRGRPNRGQELGDSPHRMLVMHTAPSISTTTYVPSTQGSGLSYAIVGVPTAFMVTVRDAWGNTAHSSAFPIVLSVTLALSPTSAGHVYDLKNGSYRIQYTALATGNNTVSVFLNGHHIAGSPFYVPVSNGNTSEVYSYVVGTGLHHGVAGIPAVFQLFPFDIGKNPKLLLDDMYVFTVVGGGLNATEELAACPYPALASPDALSSYCDYEQYPVSHYVGVYNATLAENVTIEVFLKLGNEMKQLPHSPFHAIIVPSSRLSAILTRVTGTFYDVIAGQEAALHFRSKDIYGNDMFVGGAFIEVAILGVAGDWGMVQPITNMTLPGLSNHYYYKGFHAGYPSVYGVVTDNQDGSYSASYTLNTTGNYVLRIAIAEAGLNATYFNTTSFGYLSTVDFNEADFDKTRHGAAVNMGSTVSWTGDIGRRPGVKGDIGEGSYFQRFKTRVEGNIDFNLTRQSFVWQPQTFKNATIDVTDMLQETSSSFTRAEKFRDQYWSARWVGMITPKFAEVFNFSVVVDSYSTVLLRIGGVGVATNGSLQGEVVLNITGHGGSTNGTSNAAHTSGVFNFSDTLSREFLLEYAHFEVVESHLQLQWSSPSTPAEVVPESAFSRWVNNTHRNMTVHPAVLSPSHSTVFGASVTRATVGSLNSFLVYGRDVFGNLIQTGGDVPSLVAIGPEGVGFRGQVTDYGNSTYLIEYYPTVAGIFLLYVTIGCCPPHPNVGMSAELEMIRPLLVQGAPFTLNISPNVAVPSRSIASGKGLLGGTAGTLLSFSVIFRDVHNNPTNSWNSTLHPMPGVRFYMKGSMYAVKPAYLNVTLGEGLVSVTYNLTGSGEYLIDVGFQPDGKQKSPQVTVPSPGWDPTSSPSRNPTLPPSSPLLSDFDLWESLGNAVAIIGSPYSVYINPADVCASCTSSNGPGLYTATVGQLATFDLVMRDVFGNALVVGGHRFYMRIIGVSLGTLALPTCSDSGNGQYHCSYTPTQAGFHELHVHLLRSPDKGPGGDGLLGQYYSRPFSPGDDSDGSSVELSGHFLFSRVDPSLSFSWPDGFFSAVASNNNTSVSSETGLATNMVQAPRIGDGAAVRWTGFVVAPLTDTFKFSARTSRLNVSVWIDAQLVFDSATNTILPLKWYSGIAYAITVEGSYTVSAGVDTPPTFLVLTWSSIVMKESLIPTFFLHSGADKIALSPFPVQILQLT